MKTKNSKVFNWFFAVWFVAALIFLFVLMSSASKAQANEQKLLPSWMYDPQPVHYKETGAVCFIAVTDGIKHWECKGGKPANKTINKSSNGGFGFPFLGQGRNNKNHGKGKGMGPTPLRRVK